MSNAATPSPTKEEELFRSSNSTIIDMEGLAHTNVNTQPRGAAATLPRAHPTTAVYTTTQPQVHVPDFKPNAASSPHGVVDTQFFIPNNFIYKPINLKSWNIRFNGSSCVNEFLLVVEETRLARDLDETSLLRGFSELLEGVALKFYRSIRDTVSTWSELRRLFKENFQSLDYYYNIERNIRNKKQVAGQSVFNFIVDICDLNSKLASPIPESNLLEIIKHNLLPCYAQLLSIHNIISFPQLIEVSRNFEAYSGVLQNSLLQTYIAEQGTTKVNTLAVPVQCKKCKMLGHNYRSCQTIRGILCFRCGKRDVLSSNCPNCNNVSQNINSNYTDNKNSKN